MSDGHADIVTRLEQKIAEVNAQIVDAQIRVDHLERSREQLKVALAVITEIEPPAPDSEGAE
jgi:hypothetical protein